MNKEDTIAAIDYALLCLEASESLLIRAVEYLREHEDLPYHLQSPELKKLIYEIDEILGNNDEEPGTVQ